MPYLQNCKLGQPYIEARVGVGDPEVGLGAGNMLGFNIAESIYSPLLTHPVTYRIIYLQDSAMKINYNTYNITIYEWNTRTTQLSLIFVTGVISLPSHHTAQLIYILHY